MPATEGQIDRINELSQLARTAWFSLLGYLVFVGITLLGVKDADFFVPSRQTELPLVGVQIPTASFFWIAPILGAALYTYLHLFLIKLWDAHADARTTDADATHHWLVNDFVLIRKRDPTARARPLACLTDLDHPPARLGRRPARARLRLVALHARPQRVDDAAHRLLPLAHHRCRLHQLVARRGAASAAWAPLHWSVRRHGSACGPHRRCCSSPPAGSAPKAASTATPPASGPSMT